MTRDFRHLAVRGGLGGVALFIEKGQEAVRVENVLFDPETGLQKARIARSSCPRRAKATPR